MLKQSNSDLIYIATIGKTVGFKGKLKLHIHSDFPEQFKKGVSFYVNKNYTLTINSIDLSKSIVSFVGYESMEDAKKLTNKELFTTLERTRDECNLQDGEYFWFDLVGCRVFEDDELLGEVSEVERIANANYLHIKTDTKKFLLPLIMGRFVLSVDLEKKEITTSGAKDIFEAS